MDRFILHRVHNEWDFQLVGARMDPSPVGDYVEYKVVEPLVNQAKQLGHATIEDALNELARLKEAQGY